MTNHDSVIIGLSSIIVITLCLSLLSIYVLPSYYYSIHIYRNTDIPWKLELLEGVERIGVSSNCCVALNTTAIKELQDAFIVNITHYIYASEMLKSNGTYIETEITALAHKTPKKIRLTYNGTILTVKNDYSYYLDYINKTFLYSEELEANYLIFLNKTDYDAYSTLENVTSIPLTADLIPQVLEKVFSDPSTKPDFVIYQHFDYLANFGFLQDYTTSFTRLVFIDTFGRVLFFISSEGKWYFPEI